LGGLLEVSAGPISCRRPNAKFGDAQRISLYCNQSQCEDLGIDVDDCSHLLLITVPDVVFAVREYMGGELAKHGVSEGTKSVTKFWDAYTHAARERCARLGGCAGLVAHPEHVAWQCGRLVQGNNALLSLDAAVFLAAVIEYLIVEILELAGNAARDNHRPEVTSRHVMLAVRHDEELNGMFRGCIRGGGGRSSAFQAVFANPPYKPSKTLGDIGAAADVRRMMRSKVAAARHGHRWVVWVGPCTGQHRYHDRKAHSKHCYSTLPLADALCEVGVAERRAAAIAALTADEQAVVNSYLRSRGEGCGGGGSSSSSSAAAAAAASASASASASVTATGTASETASPTATPTNTGTVPVPVPASVSSPSSVPASSRFEYQWNSRLREIRHEKQQTTLTIPPATFARAVYLTSKDVFAAAVDDADKVAKWTDEALERLQTSCEASLLKLVDNSVRCAVHGDRRIVETKDMAAAARIMGLRD
jgi:histone H2A